jgi:hypothetical protein
VVVLFSYQTGVDEIWPGVDEADDISEPLRWRANPLNVNIAVQKVSMKLSIQLNWQSQ